MPPATDVVKNAKRWAVVDAVSRKAVTHNGCEYSYFKTRKAAHEAAEAMTKRLEYEETILARAAKEPFVWTPEELDQIAKYATLLRENKERLSLYGMQTPQGHGRREHDQDAHTFESWHAWGEPGAHGSVVCAEIRLRRAARVEAFHMAGLELDRKRWRLDYRRESRDFRSYFIYGTQQEAESSRDHMITRGKEFGELDYCFEISELPEV